MSEQQIVIVGFMGSGKTTLARKLAEQLHCHSLDLDELITERHQRTPQELIDRDGEAAFRRIETEALREALLLSSTRVIAAGGGAWTIADNRELISAQGALAVWLDAPFELCWQRIMSGREIRPLARTRRQAETLYITRRPVYALADIRIPVSAAESAAEIAARVAGALVPGAPGD
jgi:shikimate kinase